MSANVLAQLGISPVLSGRIAACDKMEANTQAPKKQAFSKECTPEKHKRCKGEATSMPELKKGKRETEVKAQPKATKGRTSLSNGSKADNGGANDLSNGSNSDIT